MTLQLSWMMQLKIGNKLYFLYIIAVESIGFKLGNRESNKEESVLVSQDFIEAQKDSALYISENN
jgi:hypothetical protein